MTITELYNKANANDDLFEKITGLNKKEFAELLAYFDERRTRKLKDNDIKLFAMLLSRRYALSGKDVGNLILDSGNNSDRDGKKFLECGNTALTGALQDLSQSLKQIIEGKLATKIALSINVLDEIEQYWSKGLKPLSQKINYLQEEKFTPIHTIPITDALKVPSSPDNPEPFLQRLSDAHKKSAAKKLFTTIDTEIKNPSEEIKKSKKKKEHRKTTDFIDNVTAALKFDANKKVSTDKEKEKQVEDTAEFIIEHAARRIDFLFYTLVFYYQTNLDLEIYDTNGQHGKGFDEKFTNACHSALFPYLVDTIVELPRQHNTRSSVMPTVKTSLLDKTHFKASLDSTVLLSKAVNFFDTHYLEPEMRIIIIKTLNQVSHNKLNPIEGLKDSFITLEKHFAYLEKESNYFDGNKGVLVPSSPTKKIRTQVFNLEKTGTFECKWNTKDQKVIDSYIHMLLRMTSTEIEVWKNASKKEQEAIYEKKYLALKQEILNTKPKKSILLNIIKTKEEGSNSPSFG